jgi:hypothetical protein
MASYWHNIGNFDGGRQQWWDFLLSRRIVTAGYENSPGDTGDGKLQRYQVGDMIFAYASGHGALGYATIAPASEYTLVPSETRRDHRHQVTVEWRGHVARLDNAIGPARLRTEFGATHPRSIATRLPDGAARKLKDYFDALESGSNGLDGAAASATAPDRETMPTASSAAAFIVGKLYTREAIAEQIDLPTHLRKGGSWATGYMNWANQTFIFCNVGAAGRTGHDYPNQWSGKTLIWSGKSGSNPDQPAIRRMVSGDMIVHVFWRSTDRSPFTYAGRANAVAVSGADPVQVIWSFDAEANLGAIGPSSPVWRRGPPPVAGEQAIFKQDGPTSVYVMVLHGPVAMVFPGIDGETAIIKIGMSNAPGRRVEEMNAGFAPGCSIGWRLEAVREYPSGQDAYSAETALLERMRFEGYWIGGEFAKLPCELLSSLIA